MNTGTECHLSAGTKIVIFLFRFQIIHRVFSGVLVANQVNRA